MENNIVITWIKDGVYKVLVESGGVQHMAEVDISVLSPILSDFQRKQLTRANTSPNYAIDKNCIKILLRQLPDEQQPLTRQQAIDIVIGITGEQESGGYGGYYYRACKNEKHQWLVTAWYCDGGYRDDEELSTYILDRNNVYKKPYGQASKLFSTY